MSLTSKQIDELRAYAKDRKGELAKLLTDAADTIEMLSAKLHASQMERSSQYYHGGWIPVSERLPEYGVAVLTYDGHCFCVEKRIPTIRDDEGEPITADWWVSDDYDEYDSDYYPNLRDGACIAWMPLPEPYREEGEK